MDSAGGAGGCGAGGQRCSAGVDVVEDDDVSAVGVGRAAEALREAGMLVSNAICVVDREEGGADALARVAVRLRPLFTASELTGNKLESRGV